MAYNPNSVDAMFGVVVTRLDQQDETLKAILEEVRNTTGRVVSLEQSREVNRAQVAIISSVVSFVIAAAGWFATRILGDGK